MIKALTIFFMIIAGIAICQPRAVGIWLALAQSGYDVQSVKQQIHFEDDEDRNYQKRFNP